MLQGELQSLPCASELPFCEFTEVPPREVKRSAQVKQQTHSKGGIPNRQPLSTSPCAAPLPLPPKVAEEHKGRSLPAWPPAYSISPVCLLGSRSKGQQPSEASARRRWPPA